MFLQSFCQIHFIILVTCSEFLQLAVKQTQFVAILIIMQYDIGRLSVQHLSGKISFFKVYNLNL